MIDSTNTRPINKIMKDFIYYIFCKSKKGPHFLCEIPGQVVKFSYLQSFNGLSYEHINFYNFAKARE